MGEVRLHRTSDGALVYSQPLSLAGGEPPPDVVITGDRPGGFTVPAGETWEIGGLVTTDANVVVEGTLRMRPVATLRFVDVNESAFVGGGTEVLTSDVGLWITGDGKLDAVGTPRAGWNRTGTDPTWQAGDEILVAPTAFGDRAFQPFTPGDPVPRAYPDVPPAEVVNLTRDVVIEGQPGGKAHIMFLMTTQPQTVKHVLIRHMGVPTVAGRYALHFHHNTDGSRGSLVEGVVIRDAGRGFVPHRSHGISFRDCIVFDAAHPAYWWDPPALDVPCRPGNEPFPAECNMSDDILYEHCMAARTARSAFDLGAGHRNSCIDCVTVGVGGTLTTAGFVWPEEVNLRPNVWTFQDCVAHNNARTGIFVWQNDPGDHIVERFTAYHNGNNGIDHGAYVNQYVYRDILLVANSGGQEPHIPNGQFKQHATGWRAERVTIDTRGRPGPCVVSDRHQSSGVIEMADCVFSGGPAFELREGEAGKPAEHVFTRCLVGDRDMEPSDVVVTNNQNGCTVRGTRRDGSTWAV